MPSQQHPHDQGGLDENVQPDHNFVSASRCSKLDTPLAYIDFEGYLAQYGKHKSRSLGMRLTVGDEVREVGPGDMLHAPSGVPHGGEILGDEPVIFIDVYSPPSGGHDGDVTYF